MSSLLSWRRLAQLGPFRWGGLLPWRAGRVALGVALPLVVGWFTGHVEYGAYAALGALPAGVASLQGETRSRVAAVALASLGMAVSTFVGATTAAGAPWLLPVIVGIWAYFTGLSVCLGPLASVAVLQWTVALLIAVGLPFGPADAAVRSAFVLAGGVLQGALVAISWALRPGARERTALAQSYRAIAEYASRLAAGISTPPAPAAFPARSALDDPNPLLRPSDRLLFLELLEHAERVRAALAAVAAHDAYASELRALMGEAAIALELVAGTLTGTRLEDVALVRRSVTRIARLTSDADAAWRWSGETLLGELRSIAHVLEALASGLRSGAAAPAAARAAAVPASLRLPGTLAAAAAQLRGNVTTASEAGRHALRLAIVAGLAEALAQVTGLHQGRWVALTILIVLKPDYTSTFYRGVHRALGTALGAGLAAVVAQLAHSHEGWLIAASAMAVAAAFALFEVSYLLFSVPLTAFIVLVLAIVGMPAIANAEMRVVDTFVGAALALVAYIAWPTWQGATAQQIFAALLDAHREYATALLREFAHSGTLGAFRLRALQAAARRARSDAEAAAARLADEPAHPPITPEFAQLMIGTVADLAHAELALHALVLSRAQGAALPNETAQVDHLTTALAAAMTCMAATLRNPEAPHAIPVLRLIYAELVSTPGLHASPFVAIAHRLVDATEALQGLLRERLAHAGAVGRPRCARRFTCNKPGASRNRAATSHAHDRSTDTGLRVQPERNTP